MFAAAFLQLTGERNLRGESFLRVKEIFFTLFSCQFFQFLFFSMPSKVIIIVIQVMLMGEICFGPFS